MTFLIDLWLPLVLSAVLVFLVSSLLHMVLTYHKNDFRKLPDQDAVQTALRGFAVPPGDYFLPWAESMAASKLPEFQEKLKKGPVLTMTVFPAGDLGMGKSLALWFIFCLIVSLFAAYVGSRTLVPGTHYLQVFRVVGTTAFMGYSLALMQGSIWYKRNWCTTLKLMLDGLIYALVTAGVFGWLWPH